jgi:hypothetical protein
MDRMRDAGSGSEQGAWPEEGDYNFRRKLAEVNELDALSHAETVHRMLRDLRAVELREEGKEGKVQADEKLLFVDVADATRVVRASDVLTLKAKLFDMMATVSYAGKVLTTGSFDDFGVDSNATLSMTIKLHGGGKRARGQAAAAANTFEDALQDLDVKLTAEFNKMQGCVIAPVVHILNAMLAAKLAVDATTTEQVKNQATKLHEMFQALTNGQLEAINALAGSSVNKTAKIAAAAKHLYNAELKVLKAQAASIEVATGLSQMMVELIFTRVLGNESGEIVWTKLQRAVLFETSRRAAAGADAAM